MCSMSLSAAGDGVRDFGTGRIAAAMMALVAFLATAFQLLVVHQSAVPVDFVQR